MRSRRITMPNSHPPLLGSANAASTYRQSHNITAWSYEADATTVLSALNFTALTRCTVAVKASSSTSPTVARDGIVERGSECYCEMAVELAYHAPRRDIPVEHGTISAGAHLTHREGQRCQGGVWIRQLAPSRTS